MKRVKLGRYQHYKGKYYEVIGVARHSENLKKLVVYRGLYVSKEFGKNSLWVRPLEMFVDKVEVGGKKVPRFKFVREK